MIAFVEMPTGKLNESSIKLNHTVSPMKIKVIKFKNKTHTDGKPWKCLTAGGIRSSLLVKPAKPNSMVKM
jgi:hypothetical protein